MGDRQIDGRTDRRTNIVQMDGRTDGQIETNISTPDFVCGGIINISLKSKLL